ncbi:MAG: MarR family winged helix-turn-helix transcriptional regulator [Propionibacteriales bacterium]|nr:MarR family winged helix-turn-helix transcriptional regulator [Propionibacteriales bacterium]
MAEHPLGTRFPTAADSPGLAMWQATNRWQAAMRAALAPHGLTHVQYVLLASLVWLHGAEPDSVISQTELAAFVATDEMMTSQVVRALEAKGLILRAPHPHDGRARALRPTPAGVRAARAATGDVERADADFFSALPDLGAFTVGLKVLSGH